MDKEAKEELQKLFYDFKVEVVADIAVIKSQGVEMIKHVKETNGRVKQNEAELALIEKKIDGAHVRMIKKYRKEMLIALFVVSFLFIKESRDFILSALNFI